LVRSAFNDTKRTKSVVAQETGFSEELLESIMNGHEFEADHYDLITRTLTAQYPLAKKHLVVDKDVSEAGVWYMSADKTDASGRVLQRTNGNKDTVDYYRYMDTATSSICPFKPELIEQLVEVKDNDPNNPLVVMNTGHLLGQLTVFLGPVNFYCTIRGQRFCKVMNTGDSCLISPYVPHSFTTRNASTYSAIVACTFSGYIRDVLSDLMHHNIVDVMESTGNLRKPGTVVASLIKRFADLKGMTVGDVRTALLKQGLDEQVVESALAG